MGYSKIHCFKNNKLFGSIFCQIKTATSLANSTGSVTEKKVKSKETAIEIKIDKETIAKLEKISLVDFDNKDGVHRLEAAITFAQKLRNVQLDSTVKPLYTVLENEKLELREDEVYEGDCRDKILKNAANLEDEYFVVPLNKFKTVE